MNKINNIIRKRKALKKMCFFLENGHYILKGNDFYLEKNNEIIKKTRFYLKCSIFSRRKNQVVYSCGTLKDTSYKTIYIFNDYVFYIYKNKYLYFSLKNKYTLYKEKLIYRTIDLIFDDNYKITRCKKLNGKLFNDEQHFSLFADYYLTNVKRAPFIIKKALINGSTISLKYLPQHGDAHKGNIFWTSTDFCLIDLDDIDIYPLFYDLFYSYLSFKHERAFEVFSSPKFRNNVIACYQQLECTSNIEIDIVDLYLSQYVRFWTDKINKDTDPFEPYFYLQWFLKANLENFPLTKQEIDLYYQKANKYNKIFKCL